ncbi:N-acetylmuramoyl-L-alanine amidase [Dietzia maris]|uniref:peptidoglycan recognition protein family protein n=1 Tax=Dietzia papillomatosis TaxID=282305 RepID=UPI00078426B5|nr:peptidoglycan recognition family protein [Dietzia papillomatosis]KZO58992.1 N-acetylmuramoyl-L-alanine amidase [Dietzia maris]
MSVTRRGFLTAASVGVGAAVATSVRGPVAGADPFTTGSLGVAQDLMQSISTGSGMIQPNGPLGFVGVTFPSPEEIAGRIRFAFPDGSVGDWLPLEAMDSAPDAGSTPAAELVAAPDGAVGYEVDAPAGSEATVFDDGRGTPRNYSLGSIGLAGLPVIPRAAWGAGDVSGFRWAPTYFPAQSITIHHTAVLPGPDRAASVRAIYNYHANTLGWGDVGYHLIIDPEGRIYQGRGGTPVGNPVFQVPPVAGIAPPVVTAGHVGGVNNGNIGISLLGDFTVAPPTAAAVGATIDCVRALCNATGINPRAGITYRNPQGGATRPIMAVSGHRDWGGTACPGNSFYPQMQFIRDHAANGWTPTAISSAAFGS